VFRVENEISATLLNWGTFPAFLQVGKDSSKRTITAIEFSDQITDLSDQLCSWGIREKFVVAVFLENSSDFVAIFLSLLRIRAIPVLVKLESRTLELDEIFSNAQPHAVIAEQEHLLLLRPYAEGMIVVTRDQNRFSLAQSAEGLESREDIPDEIASINYTYRGYGYPLGALVTHAQYLHGARVLRDGMNEAPGERLLVMLPMAHIFSIVSCILIPLLYRLTSVIIDTMHPRHLFQCIHDCHVEFFSSVPEIYELLARVSDSTIDLSSLRVCFSGGSVLTPTSYANIKRAFSFELCHGYGLTEFTPVSYNRPNETRPGTVGPLCDEVDCRIDAPPSAQNGEIFVRTPSEIGEYYRRPRETFEAHCGEWFRTGDSGRIVDGHLVFEKELKNTCKINGSLVDLEEVSRAIRMDRDVEQVQVQWEKNALTARIALSRRINFEDKVKSLKSLLRRVLADHKIPKRIGALEE
jgi:long-chain acyl-CoA synthetase